MTKEEAIKMAKAALECMERDVSGCDEMCNCRKCYECNLNYEKGNMGEQKEWLRLAIKALEQESVLDKIRAEIDGLTYYWCEVNPRTVIDDVIDIIAKYKAEREE